MAGRAGLVKDVPAPRAEPEDERAPLAWWQLRSWRIDRSILIRVRDGLHALAPAPSPAAEAPLSRRDRARAGRRGIFPRAAGRRGA